MSHEESICTQESIRSHPYEHAGSVHPKPWGCEQTPCCPAMEEEKVWALPACWRHQSWQKALLIPFSLRSTYTRVHLVFLKGEGPHLLPSAQKFIFQERLRSTPCQPAATSVVLASSWHFWIHTLWFLEFIGDLGSQMCCTCKMTNKENPQLKHNGSS